MPQSLARIHVHLIFSTKHRELVIPRHFGHDLHAYMGGILRDLDCQPVEINSEPDHAHVLFLLSRVEKLSDVVRQLKTGSGAWPREHDKGLQNFHWQNGYGAFAVSQSNVEEVRKYIRGQQEHHRVVTFQEEYRKFLERHQIEYDERYVWD